VAAKRVTPCIVCKSYYLHYRAATTRLYILFGRLVRLGYCSLDKCSIGYYSASVAQIMMPTYINQCNSRAQCVRVAQCGFVIVSSRGC